MTEKLKVAIPVFGSQVFPRCDCAREILFLEFENHQVIARQSAGMEGMNSLQIANMICASGATLLICGALPGFFRRMIEARKIRIIRAGGFEIDTLIGHLQGGNAPTIRGFPKRLRRHGRYLPSRQ